MRARLMILMATGSLVLMCDAALTCIHGIAHEPSMACMLLLDRIV
jgi:hypothetical protein